VATRNAADQDRALIYLIPNPAEEFLEDHAA
jgi:hypothetical protein